MGDGTLAPEGTATRAQLAAILLRHEAAAAQLPPAPDAEIPAQPSVPTVKRIIPPYAFQASPAVAGLCLFVRLTDTVSV